MLDSAMMKKSSSGSFTSLFVNFVRWIFLLYLAGQIFFGREWSVISVGPVYTTDVTLLFLWLGVFLLFLTRRKKRELPFKMHMWAILLVAFLQLLHGLLIYNNTMMSLRQFAPFIYLTFAWALFYIYSQEKDIRKLLKFIFYCSALSVVAHVSGFSFAEYSIGHYSVWGVAVFIGLYLYGCAARRMEKRLITIGLITNLLGIFSVPVRGAWIALLLTLLFCGLMWGKSSRKKINGRVIRNSMLGLLIFVGVIFLASMINPEFESRVSSLFSIGQSISGEGGNSASEKNTEWRYLVWSDMFNAYLKQPILGYGFGDKFMPPTIVALGWGTGDSDFLDPHNSHLHFLYMLGSIGFLVFEFFFVRLVIRFINVLNQPAISDASKMLIISLLGSVGYIFLLANFEVVFESPYMVVYMWICLGLLFSAEKIAQKNLYSIRCA